MSTAVADFTAIPTKVIDPRELQKLSFCDVRKIAALRAKDRLKQELRKQSTLLARGKWQPSDWQHASMVQVLNDAHCKAIHFIWDDVVKLVDISGRHIIEYLQKRCAASKITVTPSKNRCHQRPNFGKREDTLRRVRDGRQLVFHITDIVTNLRQKAALKEMVRKKTDLLLGFGFKFHDIEVLSVGIVDYLRERYSQHWTRTSEQAFTIILKSLRALAKDYLAR